MVPKLATTTDANSADLDEFVTTLRTQLEIFVNRMKSNSSRGRSITNDSSVQTLFMNTMAMHSKLLKHIQDQEDKRVHYEGLQVCTLANSDPCNTLLDWLAQSYTESCVLTKKMNWLCCRFRFPVQQNAPVAIMKQPTISRYFFF